MLLLFECMMLYSVNWFMNELCELVDLIHKKVLISLCLQYVTSLARKQKSTIYTSYRKDQAQNY